MVPLAVPSSVSTTTIAAIAAGAAILIAAIVTPIAIHCSSSKSKNVDVPPKETRKLNDVELKDSEKTKNRLFQQYIEKCASLNRMQKKLNSLKCEYQKDKIKHQELGSLAMELYSNWVSFGTEDYNHSMYKDWIKTNAECKEIEENMTRVFNEMQTLTENIQSIQSDVNLLHDEYLNGLETYESLK